MRGRRQRQQPPPYGDIVQLRVQEIVSGGAARAHLDDGRVAFVHYAAPGELVEARIDRVHTDYVEAVTLSVLEASDLRVEAPCAVFGSCGGCQLQHLAYPAQLDAKRQIVCEQFRRIAHVDDAPVEPTVGAADPWSYRNHVRFSTGRRHGDLGFVPRDGHGLLRIDQCPIADRWVNGVLPELQGKGARLHQVQLRHNPQSGSFLVNPEIPGVSFETGQKQYTEVLAGREFVVSASAFFQVNNAQAEQMVRLVGSALPPRGRLLIDAFAGVGTFAAIFADRFERVIAIEESHSAVRDAERNLAGIPNAEIRAAKVEDTLPTLDATPDVVLLDPPRAGCFPAVIDAIIRFRPHTLVYVSCNPSTLARDARLLLDGGYHLDRVTPLDMFPQTAHIECVAQFSFEGECP
ncbi:MAG TPA: class I SAM-dependent RNA methyltransferase [Tepidiformaceae bacterium]|nr:class I SAM-dependent RNA methyltransferase [Tepidiformaceae bacterium]